MDKTFEKLGLSEDVIKAIKDMGFTEPTMVQEESIPLGLDSKDLIVMSKTGSGKTAAFGLPIIEGVKNCEKGPNALILTPTRELAVQVDKEISDMAKYTTASTTAVYGQHNMAAEIQQLKNGVNIVTGTPGRVTDHIQRKTLKTKDIKYLILDEADRMLDMGFIDQVIKIIKTLPRDRVTMLFSATMPPEIKNICRAYMKEPVTLELGTDTKTVDSIKQSYYRVEKNEKRAVLEKLIQMKQPDSCMVFCNMRHDVDKVETFLSRKGYYVEALHGAKNQSKRTKTIESFKKGKIQILVATDVAARGIHVDDLSVVINYDVPDKKDSYIHRIGRTGRAGQGGIAMTLVTGDDIMSFYDIEEHVGALIEQAELPTAEFIETCIAESTSRWAGLKRDVKPIHHTTKPHQNHQKTQYNKKASNVGKVHHKKDTSTYHKQHKDVTKPQYAKSENSKIDYKKTDVNKTDVNKTDVNKTEYKKPEYKKSEYKKTEYKKADVTANQGKTSKENKGRYETYEINGKKVKVLVAEKAGKKSVVKRITSIFKK